MEKTSPMHPKPLVNATCKLGQKGCYSNGKCHYLGNCENKIVTNADLIRAMSDEELADVVVCPHIGNWDSCRDDCKKCRLEWLKQPCEGDI